MELWEKHLGRNYELVDVLKKTQGGTVALVYDKIGKQVCILKQMDARALETYRLIKEIKSPHVPSIYRLFLQDGNLLLIEEFIDGRTLADLLKYGETMEEDFAIHVLRELCLCLRPFHERNIIHRDIKPSNIVVTKKNEIKLIDFGIARVVKEGDEADTSSPSNCPRKILPQNSRRPQLSLNCRYLPSLLRKPGANLLLLLLLLLLSILPIPPLLLFPKRIPVPTASSGPCT